MLHESDSQALELSMCSQLSCECWSVKRQSGSHRTLARDGWPDVVFAFHDAEELGSRMLARLGKRTGLRPDDL